MKKLFCEIFIRTGMPGITTVAFLSQKYISGHEICYLSADALFGAVISACAKA